MEFVRHHELDFVLLGLALVRIDRITERDRWPAQEAALAAASLALLECPRLYLPNRPTSLLVKTTPMSLHTLITFILLGVGFLFSRPASSFVPKPFEVRRFLEVVDEALATVSRFDEGRPGGGDRDR